MFVFKGFGSDQDLHRCKKKRKIQETTKNPLVFYMTINDALTVIVSNFVPFVRCSVAIVTTLPYFLK